MKLLWETEKERINDSMIYSPQDILNNTQTLLKYDEDERLDEASPQHLHNALARAVMLAVGDNWSRRSHGSAG